MRHLDRGECIADTFHLKIHLEGLVNCHTLTMRLEYYRYQRTSGSRLPNLDCGCLRRKLLLTPARRSTCLHDSTADKSSSQIYIEDKTTASEAAVPMRTLLPFALTFCFLALTNGLLAAPPIQAPKMNIWKQMTAGEIRQTTSWLFAQADLNLSRATTHGSWHNSMYVLRGPSEGRHLTHPSSCCA